MKRKNNKFQKKSFNSLNKLSLFQKNDSRYNKKCPLSVKNAPILDYKNISLLKKYISEELKSKAEEAERAYTQALNDARSEASRLLDASKAEMKKELQAAISKADAEISVKVGESEKSIAEIRKNAMASIEKVAKDTAKEFVLALGTKADAKTINAAVSSKMKG